MPAQVATHWEMGWSTLKSGKPGRRWVCLYRAPYCPVAHCENCGRPGSPAWIRHWYLRPAATYRRWRSNDAEPRLCMSCMNRMRPHWRRQDAIDENKLIINRIKKEAARVKAEHRRGA